jgi:predicted outer membrane repeat protein
MNLPRLLCAVPALALAAAVTAAPAAPASADAVTVVQRQTDTNPGQTNPCTGTTGTIVDNEQDVFHLTSLADGTLELSGHNTTTVSFLPDDPNGVAYSGHETSNFSATGGGAVLATTFTTQLRVRGSDGSFATFRDVAHLTITATEVRVEFERPTMRCS